MARISLVKALVSAGYGIVDIGFQELDAAQGWGQPFRNATDIGRTAVCLGSLAVNLLGYETENTETLFYSSLPKLEESIYRAAKTAVAAGGAAPPTFVPPASSGEAAATQAQGAQGSFKIVRD